MSFPTSQHATFVKRKGRFAPLNQSGLANSLLAGVGYLELANAGDFAANVWNQIPIPRFAMALMALGGSLAISISYFAIQDARLSWSNVLFLRGERDYLRAEKARHIQDGQIVHDLDAKLDVNLRETGTELVDRVGMDILMGCGAILVGIGTFMAMGGANPSVFHTSNLLSGYIGNAPAAVYGVLNIAWSFYVWARAHRHDKAGCGTVSDSSVKPLLKRRVRTVKLHAAVNGLTGLIGGVASILTATRWQGYIILIPAIISSIGCNYLWRHRIGYSRLSFRYMSTGDAISLVSESKFVALALKTLQNSPSKSLDTLIQDRSNASVIEFITKNGLFEEFCICLLKDERQSTTLFGPLGDELTIDSSTLLAANDISLRFYQIAQMCVNEVGRIHFRDRERYLLEILGCYLCIQEAEVEMEEISETREAEVEMGETSEEASDGTPNST